MLIDEDLAANSARQGAKLLKALTEMATSTSAGRYLINTVRGRGLFMAVVINEHGMSHTQEDGDNDIAWDICIKLAELGLLAKPTHGNIIRFAPPLVINDSEVCSSAAAAAAVTCCIHSCNHG